MKYVVFQAVLPAGDMSVQTFLTFPDHLNHFDVAHANKQQIAEGYGTTEDLISFVGAGFVSYHAGLAMCWGFSDSLGLYSRGKDDEDVINATMLHFDDVPDTALERIHGRAAQMQQTIRKDLELTKGVGYVLTMGMRCAKPSGERDYYPKVELPAFIHMQFEGIHITNLQTYFVFSYENELHLLVFGDLFRLVRADVATMSLIDNRRGFVCKQERRGIKVGDQVTISGIEFEPDHDPDKSMMSVGTFELTVNGEEQVQEMPLAEILYMINPEL